MPAQVRAARTEDEQALSALLKTVRPDDPGHVCGWVWLLEDEGVLLGAGSLASLNTVHPYRTTLNLRATDAAYHGGAAALLLSRLQSLRPPDTRWRTTIRESEQLAGRFLEAHGFTLVRRTWTPEVPLSAFPADWGRAETQQAEAQGYTVQSERVTTAEFRAELTLAHLEHYRATHSVNPAGDLPLSEWESIFMKDLDSVWTARRHGVLAAFASLRGGGEVYWFGTVPEFAHDAEMLNLALGRAEVAHARAEGLSTLNFELDSTSPESVTILHRLPVAIGEALLTYQT